ncbi:MAG: hypothetical protein K2W97_01575 [Chthoniobacterales bacterium]|nr:hypothetical protein [Chthoniobacterales bacterium]
MTLIITKLKILSFFLFARFMKKVEDSPIGCKAQEDKRRSMNSIHPSYEQNSLSLRSNLQTPRDSLITPQSKLVVSLDNGSQIMVVTDEQRDRYKNLLGLKVEINDKYRALANNYNQKLTYFGAFIHTFFSKDIANRLAPNYAEGSNRLVLINELKNKIDSEFTKLDSIITTDNPKSLNEQFSTSLQLLKKTVDQLTNLVTSPYDEKEELKSNDAKKPIDENFSDPEWWRDEDKLSQKEKTIPLLKEDDLNSKWSCQANLTGNWNCDREIKRLSTILPENLLNKDHQDRYYKLQSIAKSFRELEEKMMATSPPNGQLLKDFSRLNRNEKISYLILAQKIREGVPHLISLIQPDFFLANFT